MYRIIVHKLKQNNLWKIWTNSVDILTFCLILCLIIIGLLLVVTSSPAVAERIDTFHFHFLYRHIFFAFISIPIMIIISILPEKLIIRISVFGFILTILSLIILPWIGVEIKGSIRWLNIFGISIQPSEFLKPFYAVVIAVILNNSNEGMGNNKMRNFMICSVLHVFVSTLLIMQPDFGMAITITIITLIQMFVAGLPWLLIFILSIFLCFVSLIAYYKLPHVAKRITSFLDEDTLNGYQVQKSLESYINGGLFGKGPGEGNLKYLLPDSHTDFIFAVAGEELGAIFCFIIILLISFIVIRGILNIMKLNNPMYCYIGIAVIMYFAFQSIFNIGVTLHLLPTKGMTLPFISYGGSSMISFAFSMGLYFNVTKIVKGNNYINRKIYINTPEHIIQKK